MASHYDNLTTSFDTREDAAQFVYELLQVKQARPMSITITKPGKSGEFCAVIVTAEWSDVIEHLISSKGRVII